jgi:glycine/D-amino acid oxidase-like deaminating enzyme
MKRAIFALALLAAAAGCRKREYVAPDGSTVQVEGSGKSVTIQTSQGTVAVSGSGSATLPAGFPKDIPMYPGARVAIALDAVGDTAGHVVTIESADWPDDLAKFYGEKLAGWKTAMDMKTEDGHTLILRSPDGRRSLTLAATREALKTVATLTVDSK